MFEIIVTIVAVGILDVAVAAWLFGKHYARAIQRISQLELQILGYGCQVDSLTCENRELTAKLGAIDAARGGA